jgi:hypothetical protein
MEVQFNTGRPYTANGQVIRAIMVADGSVIFADDSRGIDGVIAGPVNVATLDDLKRVVLDAYDRNAYTRSEASWSFLMQRPR